MHGVPRLQLPPSLPPFAAGLTNDRQPRCAARPISRRRPGHGRQHARIADSSIAAETGVGHRQHHRVIAPCPGLGQPVQASPVNAAGRPTVAYLDLAPASRKRCCQFQRATVAQVRAILRRSRPGPGCVHPPAHGHALGQHRQHPSRYVLADAVIDLSRGVDQVGW